MIICFNNKINTFSKFNKNNFSFSQNDIQNLMPSCEDINCNCPNCNAKSNFSFHGSYNRNISFICEDRIYDFKVIVTRVICNSCGSTHSLLPSFIVPYKIFSCDSILNVVSEVSTTSVINVAEKFKISFQLIYSFLAIFMSFFPQVDLLNKQFNLYKNFNQKYFALNCISLCDYNFLLRYFLFYHWVFLMTKFRNYTSPPITIGFNLTSST